MRRALLIYNPHSGHRRQPRQELVQAAAGVLRQGGVEAAVVATKGPGSAGQQAREAPEFGYDTVIACGGDGTVNEALQGLAGCETHLGVLPLGTGNALAYDLCVPREPISAARVLLNSAPQRMPLGRVDYTTPAGSASRYFLAVAGAGADAELLYQLGAQVKARYGMLAYYAVATRLWFTHCFVPFEAQFVEPKSGRSRKVEVSELLAVHIDRFGELLHQLSPGASLASSDFRLVLFKTRSRLRYLSHVLGIMLRQNWPVRGVEITPATKVVLDSPADNRRVYIEADGEVLGTLPATIQMTSETVSLLVPREKPERLR